MAGARWETDPEDPGVLSFVIEADAFLRSMIRVLVGTMLEVARGRRTPAEFAALLDGSPRSEAGVTAPPHGLTLIGVGYAGRSALAPDPAAVDACAVAAQPR